MGILKKTLNTTAICALTAAMAFSVTNAKATDVTADADATVAAALDFVQTTAMSFATIGAVSDAVDTAQMLMDNAGSLTDDIVGPARLSSISGAASQGVFTLTNGLTGPTVFLTLPSAAVTLTCGACAPGTPTFSLDTFTSDMAGGQTVLAGADVVVNVGATLNTIASATAYEAGDYSGNYTISLNY